MTTTNLARMDAPIVGVAMMDAAEARASLDMMRTEINLADHAIDNFRLRALEFKEREGWRALGYGGWIEAIQKELSTDLSKSYLSRIVSAAEIERMAELPTGQLSERAIRPLGVLDSPEEIRQAVQIANEATGGRPTAKAMQAAVEQIKPRAGAAPAITQDDEAAIARELGPPPMPDDLYTAGFRWSHGGAGMIAIVGADGWHGDAPTPSGMLQLARDRMAAKQAIEIAGDTKPAAKHFQQAAAEIKPPATRGVSADDARHIYEARQLLDNLSAWDESIQPDVIKDAYKHAQQVRDRAARENLFAEIDAALDGTAEAVPAIVPSEQELAEAENHDPNPPTAVAPPNTRRVPDWNEVARLTYALGAERDHAAGWETWQQIGHALVCHDARIFAANLLRMLASLMTDRHTDDLESLSQAISDLNECQEGTEAEHWVNVGWALLDLEAESAGVPALESEGIHVEA